MRETNTKITHAKTLIDIKTKSKKYNCNGPQPFKSQRGYHPNQKFLHHYQHPKNQLNS